jgi:hypothetical protein
VCVIETAVRCKTAKFLVPDPFRTECPMARKMSIWKINPRVKAPPKCQTHPKSNTMAGLESQKAAVALAQVAAGIGICRILGERSCLNFTRKKVP